MTPFATNFSFQKLSSLAQAKSHFAPAPSICAYLRSSRQGAFCGHSAMPNATLFTPVAPLHENLFIENIFVIAAVQFQKSECGAAILLRLRRREKTRGQPQGVSAGCLSKSRLFSASVRGKKCEQILRMKHLRKKNLLRGCFLCRLSPSFSGERRTRARSP